MKLDSAKEKAIDYLKRQKMAIQMGMALQRGARNKILFGGDTMKLSYNLYEDATTGEVSHETVIKIKHIELIEKNLYKIVTSVYNVPMFLNVELTIDDVERLFSQYLVDEEVTYMDSKKRPVDYQPEDVKEKAV